MIYIVEADSPANAVLALPRIGDVNPDNGLRIVQYDVAAAPRSFFDWLFRRAVKWEVNVTFEYYANPRDMPADTERPVRGY